VLTTREQLLALRKRQNDLFQHIDDVIADLGDQETLYKNDLGELRKIVDYKSNLNAARLMFSSATEHWGLARDAWRSRNFTEADSDYQETVGILNEIEATLKPEDRPVSTPPTSVKTLRVDDESVPEPKIPDDNLAELLRKHIENCDRQLDGIARDVTELKKGTLSTEHSAALAEFTPETIRHVLGGESSVLTDDQKKLLIILESLLSDEKSVKGLETTLRIAKWLNRLRKPIRSNDLVS